MTASTWSLVHETEPPVLTGFDGSAQSVVAAAVAATEAQLRRLPLRLICRPGADRTGSTDLLCEAVRRLPEGFDNVQVDTDSSAAGLPSLLVEGSREASLLVVSTRHTGGYDRLLERWLGDWVISRAGCPVLVVGPDADAVEQHGGVLLGVDRSAHCLAAVPLAFEEAALRHTTLRACAVYHRDPLATYRDAVTAPTPPEELIAEALAGWRDKYPQVPVSVDPRYATDPASTLVDASAGAQLVVVGARGCSTVTSLLLGSTARALVAHAHCPVLVAHARV